jgi:small subunit ribosomal protein S18
MTASPGAPSSSRPAGPARRRPGEFSAGGRKFTPRRKVCQFCVDKIKDVDYKDLARLRRFLSERGKIEPRRKTGTCAAHQRSLNVALKRARQLALLPFTAEHIRVTGVLVREPGTPPFRGARPRPQELEGAPEAAPAAPESAPEADGAGEARADGQATAPAPSPAPPPASAPETAQPVAEPASPTPARETAATVPSMPEA